MAALVSVVIPTHNRAWCILDCIQSVIQQDYPHIEIIVVDDGSTDDTLSLVSTHFPTVHIFRRPKLGANHARNYGLAQARGEYVQFLDSDDLLLNEKISKQVMRLEESNTATLCLCETLLENPKGEQRIEKKFTEPNNEDLFRYFLKNKFATSVPLHRRTTLLKLGGFREDLPRYQDFELHLRIALNGGKALLVSEALYLKRLHRRKSISNTVADPRISLTLMIDLYRDYPSMIQRPEIRQIFSQSLEERAWHLLPAGHSQLIYRALRLSQHIQRVRKNHFLEDLSLAWKIFERKIKSHL